METLETTTETEEQKYQLELSEKQLKELVFLLKEQDTDHPMVRTLLAAFDPSLENKAMSYRQFWLKEAMETFDIKGSPDLDPDLFAEAAALSPSEHLQKTLRLNKAIPAKSEKSRSETIITPILVEVAQRNRGKFNVLSGERMDVDATRGLSGECDYVFHTFSLASVLLEPVFALVEAKKGDIDEGLGQCVAQMVGVRELNQEKGKEIPAIYGCVTNGSVWRFLRLAGNELVIDSQEYYLSELDQILGIFQFIVDEFGRQTEKK